MVSTSLDLPFTDADGRPHILKAFTTDDGSWFVEAEVDGDLITQRCSDWSRVERLRTWLQSRARQHQPLEALAFDGGRH